MASFVIFFKDDKVCLMRRQGTNHMCGKMSLPAGHVDQNESFRDAAIREMREEVGISLTTAQLQFAVMEHSHGCDYVNAYFIARKWDGEIKINEPEKCSEISWHAIDNLPEDTIPYIRSVLENLDEMYQER